MPNEAIISVSVITAVGILLGGLWAMFRSITSEWNKTQQAERAQLIEIISRNAATQEELAGAVNELRRDVGQLIMRQSQPQRDIHRRVDDAIRAGARWTPRDQGPQTA